MPFVKFTTAPSFARYDPVAEFLAAALGAADATAPKARCAAACAPKRTPARRIVKRVINPDFDVSELENTYVLEGELPGVADKNSISISFDDAQTIVIKGEVKRATRPFSEHKLTEEALQAAAAAADSAAETAVEESEDQPKEKVRYSATVEDTADESETASNASNDFELLDGPNGPTKADKGKAKATDDVEMTEAKPAEEPKQQPQQPEEPKAKFWVAERSVGVFERKFNFQGLIDQDNVKAHLEDGLLTVVVPKRQAYVRQVQIE